jgi:hypothetical protein
MAGKRLVSEFEVFLVAGKRLMNEFGVFPWRGNVIMIFFSTAERFSSKIALLLALIYNSHY